MHPLVHAVAGWFSARPPSLTCILVCFFVLWIFSSRSLLLDVKSRTNPVPMLAFDLTQESLGTGNLTVCLDPQSMRTSGSVPPSVSTVLVVDLFLRHLACITQLSNHGLSLVNEWQQTPILFLVRHLASRHQAGEHLAGGRWRRQSRRGDAVRLWLFTPSLAQVAARLRKAGSCFATVPNSLLLLMPVTHCCYSSLKRESDRWMQSYAVVQSQMLRSKINVVLLDRRLGRQAKLCARAVSGHVR